MASTDALPIPRKNVAYRVYFPISKSDGSLITGAASPDTEISKDGGTFTDLTDEVHELATSSGIYYVDITNTEMNADNVILKITCTSAGAITQVVILYPQEAGDIRVNPTYWNDTAVASPDTAGYPKVTIKQGTGAGELSLTSGVPDANVTKVAGTSQTARDLGANLDVAVSTRMASFTLPTNFSAFSIDSSGRVTVIGNQDKTGYALSAAGVQAVWDALTSALTTTNSIGKRLVDDIDATISSRSTYAGADTSGTTTLLARLTALRAGYMDFLNIGGNVASSAEVTIIQNNTRVVRVVPDTFERPDSGSTAFRVELLIYDEAGNMEAPDAAPTIAVVNQAGTSRDPNLDSTTMTLVSTGRYRSTYTIDTAHAIEQLIFSFSVVEGGATRVYANASFVVDTTAVDFTSADRTKLDAVYGKLPSKTYLTGTANSDGDVQADEMTGPLTLTTNLDKTGYGLADDAITAAKIAADAIGSSELAASAITEIQSGLATSAGLTSVQTHGDSTWATADVSNLPTLTELEDDLDALQAHGDSSWPTAVVTGLSTVTTSQVRTQVDNALVALRLNELLAAALTGAAHSGSALAALLAGADPWAVDLETSGYSGTEAGSLLLEVFQRALMISQDGVNFVGVVDPIVNQFTVVQNTDYSPTSGVIVPSWSSSDWSSLDLDTAAVVFRAIQNTTGAVVFEKAMTVVDATHIELRLTAAETDALSSDKAKPYYYQIVATLSGGERNPLVPLGKMVVLAEI